MTSVATGAQLGRSHARAHRGDPVVLQQDIAGVVDVLGVVDRDDGAVFDQDAAHECPLFSHGWVMPACR